MKRGPIVIFSLLFSQVFSFGKNLETELSTHSVLGVELLLPSRPEPVEGTEGAFLSVHKSRFYSVGILRAKYPEPLPLHSIAKRILQSKANDPDVDVIHSNTSMIRVDGIDAVSVKTIYEHKGKGETFRSYQASFSIGKTNWTIGVIYPFESEGELRSIKNMIIDSIEVAQSVPEKPETIIKIPAARQSSKDQELTTPLRSSEEEDPYEVAMQKVGSIKLLLPSKPIILGDGAWLSKPKPNYYSVGIVRLEFSDDAIVGVEYAARSIVNEMINDPQLEASQTSVSKSEINGLEVGRADVNFYDKRRERNVVSHFAIFWEGTTLWEVRINYPFSNRGKVSPLKDEILMSIALNKPDIRVNDLRHLPTDSRPVNGSKIDSLTQNGSMGELTIRNGRESDAHVKVTRAGRTRFEGYIRASDQILIDGIPDGTYNLLFSFGYGWDPDIMKFTRGREAFEFDKDFDFVTRRVGNSVFYDTRSVTLYSVIGGNASTSKLSLEEFDRY